MNSFIEAANKAEQQTVIDRETKELVKVYSQADLDKQKSISVQLRRDLFSHDSPRNAEELYKYLDVVYGLKLATTVSDPKWNSPFEWAHAMYFDKYSTLLAVAPRGSGKTYGASVITYDKCAHRQNYSAVHVGSRLDQADVAQQYLTNFAIDPVLNGGLDRKGIGKKRARWDSTDATWKIVSGTTAGVCLSGSTSIITDKGTIPIEQIVNKRLEVKVKSYNFETKEIEWKPIIGWHNNGRHHDFINVRTTHQRQACSPSMTGNHRVLRPDGSKSEIGTLQTGDEVLQYGYVFSYEQEQIILGGIMGDASYDSEGKYKITHGKNQKYYLDWKADALEDNQVVFSRYSVVGGYSSTECYTASTSQPQFTDRYKKWYGTGKKRVQFDELENLGPLGLAVWLMDDGGVSEHGTWSIYTNCFEEDIDELIRFFHKRGLPSAQITRDKLNQPVVLFNQSDSRVISEVIKEWLTVDEKQTSGWKKWIASPLLTKGREGVVPQKIKTIEPKFLRSRQTKKYDITVEDNHNYFIASGMLVSNSGQHPQMLSIDEIEFADEQMIEQSWPVPVERDGWPRLWTGFSTRQRASSMMSKLTQDAENGTKKIKLMQWSIFEVMQPCVECKALDAHPHGGTPDVEAARCDVCPLWRWCRGELNRKSTGWMKLDNVINIMSTMNEDSIETQLLCLRPSTHGQVLHNFRHEHATATERSKGNYFAWTHQKDMPFYVWIDPAETKKGCALFVQIHNGRIFAFDEIVDDSGPTTEDLKEAVHKKCREGGYGEPKKVVLDPRRTDTKKTWVSGTLEGNGKDHCFNAAFPNIKNGMDDIEAGLDLVRTYILNGVGERRFFINPITCPKFVEAITGNMYKIAKDNQIHQNTKQNEKWKDEIDTIRYGIIDAHRSGGGASV